MTMQTDPTPAQPIVEGAEAPEKEANPRGSTAADGGGAGGAAAERLPGSGSIGARVMDLLGSYGLACLCLFALFVLTFQGTLYQVDHGLYAAKQRFFESWFVWTDVAGMSVPTFPGGLTSMSVLALNLLVGGLIRLRVTKRNVGVAIIHVGIVFMLCAGLVKLAVADEGHLTLFEGERSSHFVSYNLWEVAIWKGGETGDTVVHLIDDEHITDLTDGRSRTFTSPDIPFDLRLSGFLPNCEVLPKGPMWQAAGPVVEGFGLRPLPWEKEAERNVAGLHASADVGGEVKQGILWGFERHPWTVEVDGEVWGVSLRHQRYPMPFTIVLEDFQKEDHPGITMAKAYRSEVQKIEDGQSERILIQMNEPLRHAGLVLFQSGWGPQNAGPGARLYSTFSVVDNPSDKWPEYSLWVITVGLLMAFGRKLLAFLRSQSKRRALETEGVR